MLYIKVRLTASVYRFIKYVTYICNTEAAAYALLALGFYDLQAGISCSSPYETYLLYQRL